MSYYRVLQDVQTSPRRVQGVTVAALLEKIRTEGVALLGLGVANRATLPLLSALSPRRVFLRSDTPPVGEDATALRALSAEISVGAGFPALPPVGVVIRSPSVRPDIPCLQAARAAGATVTTEIALALALTPAEIYCVTGSDGKTTTATITAAILRAAGRRVFLGGNIGTPLLPLVPDMRAGDCAVFEVSSFQLADLDPPCGRCAITGVTENHLDWHTDMQEYTAAKARILGGGTAVLPEGLFGDYPAVRFGEAIAEGEAVTLLGDAVVHRDACGRLTPLFSRTALPLRGRHNLVNAMAAAALTLGTEPACVQAAIEGLSGIPHRMTYLGRFRGCDCYDASIDTTPARTLTTLRAMPAPPIVLLGGRNKGLTFGALSEALPALSAGCVLFGECADKIAAEIALADPAGAYPCQRAASLDGAVRAALALSAGRHPILLSPAAASFDMFTDYRARGKEFHACLCRLREE